MMYSGLEYSDSGVQAIRAAIVLWALAGQLDVPGGRCFSMRENFFRVNRDGLISNPDIKKALGRDRFPVYTLYRDESHPQALPEAVLNGNPYPVKALVIQGSSIITSWPDPALWKKTLGGLDLLVCVDWQMTADMAYADIVLPAATMYGGGPVGPEAWRLCNINELTDINRYAPISGFPVYKALLCEVRKEKAYAAGKSNISIIKTGENISVISPLLSGEILAGKTGALPGGSKSLIVQKSRIYLDHNATTPLAPEVLNTMVRLFESAFGNPSSLYREGREAKVQMEAARRSVAYLLNCTSRRIVFTGGFCRNITRPGRSFRYLSCLPEKL